MYKYVWILSWCFMIYSIEQETIVTVLINFEFIDMFNLIVSATSDNELFSEPLKNKK